MRKYLLLIILFSFAFSFYPLSAQTTMGYEPSLLYKKEQNFGILFHTRGMGFAYQTTRYVKADRFRLFDFNLINIKHPKETKLPNPGLPQSRPYVFGKLNSLYTLNASFGGRRVMADRIMKQSVRINWNYAAGPTLGILKPIYYDVKLNRTDVNEYEYIQVRFEEDNLRYQQNTIGPASVLKGLNELGFLPGGNAKTSLSFEWGMYEDKFYSLETGVMLNAFPFDVPIFAFNENQKVFINLFFTLTYGTRK